MIRTGSDLTEICASLDRAAGLLRAIRQIAESGVPEALWPKGLYVGCLFSRQAVFTTAKGYTDHLAEAYHRNYEAFYALHANLRCIPCKRRFNRACCFLEHLASESHKVIEAETQDSQEILEEHPEVKKGLLDILKKQRDELVSDKADHKDQAAGSSQPQTGSSA